MLNPVGRADASTVDVAALREDEAGAAVLTVMGPAGARSIPLPEAGRLNLHPLPPGRDVAQTVLFWRKGAESPKVTALADMVRAVGEKGQAA